PAAFGPRTNVSKNHVVCARCHLVGLTSGMDCTVWSSPLRGSAKRSVVARTPAYAAGRSDGVAPLSSGIRSRPFVVPMEGNVFRLVRSGHHTQAPADSGARGRKSSP